MGKENFDRVWTQWHKINKQLIVKLSIIIHILQVAIFKL